MSSIGKIFETDELSKRERVERTLNHSCVDRVAMHDQLSYNPGVISEYTGKTIDGFNYTIDDICCAISKSLDMTFPPRAPRGTQRVTNPDGFVIQHDNWTSWHVSRPFDDVEGAKKWLLVTTDSIRAKPFDKNAARAEYRRYMQDLQKRIGDDTVICSFSPTGFSSVFDNMGLELFVYFYEEYPQCFSDFLEVSVSSEISRAHAIADIDLSPVILIPEDFATKHGPIFPPDFLVKEHFPHIKALTKAWHQNGIKVIYHSDGNWKKVIPQLLDCEMDGFYCLEPNVGMDIVELKNTWPNLVWAGGVDGVDLMERGTTEGVRDEVHRHIRETDAIKTGGMFIGSSSEINPPIKPENFRAMIEAVDDI